MAPTFLLLPGTLCDERLWQPVLARLDLPGATIVADLRHDATIVDMAARAAAGIQGPIVAIGFSMGAIVALEMARQCPGRLAGLALLAVNPGADLPERAAIKPRQQADARAGRLREILADELKPNYLADANRRDAGLLALLMQMGLDLGADVFVRQSEALRTRADLRPHLSSLPMPVLLLAGAQDPLCPPAWHASAAAVIPRATAVVVEEAGHMLPLEQPGRAADAITAWLHAERILSWQPSIAS